jgi:hypothetical protein
MKLLVGFATVAALWTVTASTAFAVFSIGPPPLPEPTTMALLVAGGLAAGGLRYLSRRKRNK